MGTFELDMATGRVARDRNLEELYGLEPGAASTLAEWASLIHPDDRAMVLDHVARVATEGGEYRLVHRLVHADGQVRWLERRGHAYAGPDGRVAGIRGVVVGRAHRRRDRKARPLVVAPWGGGGTPSATAPSTSVQVEESPPVRRGPAGRRHGRGPGAGAAPLTADQAANQPATSATTWVDPTAL